MPRYTGSFVGWIIGEGKDEKYYHDACLTSAINLGKEKIADKLKVPITTDDLGENTFVCDYCGKVIEYEEE